jgi:hypothetical protein
MGWPGRHSPIRLFLAEFTLPTDHANHEFNFWVTRKVQANWLAAALRITRRWSRIYALGWIATGGRCNERTSARSLRCSSR